MSSRRTIRTGTYSVPPYVIVTYVQEPGWWYVTTPSVHRCMMRHKHQPAKPHEHTLHIRAILPPFRSLGAAVLAAHQLVANGSENDGVAAIARL